MSDEVRIVEVGPRDGLQNEKLIFPTDLKIDFIELLIEAGIKYLEATSFVNPKAIAQMADAKELYAEIKKRGLDQKANLSCLVPNKKGLDSAIELGVKEIAVFTATSETFTKKNINATIEESLQTISLVTKEALSAGIKVRGYISTAFGCPYEGEIKREQVVPILEKLFKIGCYEVSIGDTIGVATPLHVVALTEKIKEYFDLNQIAMHFHDTRGMALTNIYESFLQGIRVFDSSAGGLGGCPYAKGATGNVATEDVWYLFQSLGINIAIDIEKLVNASQIIFSYLKKESSSRFHNVVLKNRE